MRSILILLLEARRRAKARPPFRGALRPDLASVLATVDRGYRVVFASDGGVQFVGQD